jgi:CheY-like chemotaxis protein
MKKKILVADDSITIQRVIQISFPEDEFEVICVGNGKEALDKIESFSPDLVLTDVIMPETDGYALCKTIKSSADLSHIPVLMLVGSFEPFDEDKAEESRADGIITKPFDRAMLVEKVKQTLQPDLKESTQETAGKSSHPSFETKVVEESGTEDFPISLDKDSVIDLSKPSEAVQGERREELIDQTKEEKAEESEGIPGETKAIRLNDAEIEAIARKLIDSLPKNLLGDIIKASITAVAEKIIKEKIKELEEKASK